LARTSIYCERCGAVVPVDDLSAEARYCVGCQLYTCDACWDGEAVRCATCHAQSADKGDPQAQLDWAILGFRELSMVRPELDSLATAVKGPLDAERLERRLLTIRARDSTATALRALGQARQGEEERELRQQVELERLRIAAVSRATEEPRRQQLQLPALPSGVRAIWRRPSPISGVSPSAAFAVASFGAAILLMATVVWPAIRTGLRAPQAGVASTPTPEGAVAGGNPSRKPAVGPMPVAPMNATFDEIVIGGAIPREWRIIGDASNVEVAPFPNAVDRSLRLISADDGSPTSLCHTLVGHLSNLVVDLYAADPAGLTLSLKDQAGSEGGIEVSRSGRVLLDPGSQPLTGPGFDAGTWVTVGLLLDESALRITVGGSTARVPWSSTATAAELCLASPTGAGADLFVDNVTID
jgi:hypothetical protein